MQSPDFGNGGYRLPRYAEAVEDVVPGHVVRDESEERSKRVGLAESAGAGQLSDGLDLAAQIATRHDTGGT